MRSAYILPFILVVYVAAINGQLTLFNRLFGLREPFKPTRTIPASPEDKKLYCAVPRPNYHSKALNRDFFVSWKCGPAFYFTATEMEEICKNNSMVPVSLNDPKVFRDLSRVLIQDGGRYFWTGGKINHTLSVVTWPNGVTQKVSELRNLFSKSGALGVSQPDNRELDEYCLALLNNFYADGLKLHDVSCDYAKPIVCEALPKPTSYIQNFFKLFY